MRSECESIRKLIPLYAEGIVSGKSRLAVDSHCESCNECRAERDAAVKKTAEEKSLFSAQSDTAVIPTEKQTRRKAVFVTAAAVIVYLLLAVLSLALLFIILDNAFPEIIPTESYKSVEQAMSAYKENVINENDTDWDVWPPYKIVYRQEIGDKIIIIHTCKYDPDDKDEQYMFQAFDKGDDGSISFGASAFLDEVNITPFGKRQVCFELPVKTEEGEKIVDYYCLPYESGENYILDGTAAEKIKIENGNDRFCVCVLVRDKGNILEEFFGTINAEKKVDQDG